MTRTIGEWIGMSARNNPDLLTDPGFMQLNDQLELALEAIKLFSEAWVDPHPDPDNPVID